MNRQEAIKLDNDIKNKLQKYANDIGIDEKTGSYIVDNYIEIIPDDDVAKGMLFVSDTKITSYKAENFKVDLKKSIIAGLELFASVSMPENIIKYIQLLI